MKSTLKHRDVVVVELPNITPFKTTIRGYPFEGSEGEMVRIKTGDQLVDVECVTKVAPGIKEWKGQKLIAW